MRKILLAIAYFEGCQAALELGGRLARGLGAAITVLHVASLPRGTLLGKGVASGKLAEWGLELPSFKLLRQAQELLEELGVVQIDLATGKPKVKHTLKELAQGVYEVHLLGRDSQDIRFRLREGEPVAEILREAEDPEYDLIITGTRGHRGFKRFFVGSVAQEVAQHAPCSVLVAKNPKPNQSILVGVSGRETALEAVRQAGQLARALGRPLKLLTIVEDEVERSKAERHLDEAQAQLRSQGLQAERTVRVGDPAHVLIEEAGEDHLVVLGRAQRSRVRELFLGDISLTVLEQSLGPVLLTSHPRFTPSSL
jgi:nucleotide-binding universal stress UspA family protein